MSGRAPALPGSRRFSQLITGHVHYHISRHASRYYLQLAALFRQKNLAAAFIMRCVTLPGYNVGLFEPFQELAEYAGVQPDARTDLRDREAIIFPQYQQHQVLRIG